MSCSDVRSSGISACRRSGPLGGPGQHGSRLFPSVNRLVLGLRSALTAETFTLTRQRSSLLATSGVSLFVSFAVRALRPGERVARWVHGLRRLTKTLGVWCSDEPVHERL